MATMIVTGSYSALESSVLEHAHVITESEYSGIIKWILRCFTEVRPKRRADRDLY
jgi:hypothetical protein